MATLSPDLEKQPMGGGMNKPASGTYGEKVDLERLKQQLPSSGQPAVAPPGGPRPMSQPSGPGPRPIGRPMSGPPGVPSPLMAPSTTGTPVGTPLARGGPSGIVSSQQGIQARIAILEQLSSSPEVSSATREWAKLVLEMLSEAV